MVWGYACSSRDSNGDVAWVAESSSLTLEMWLALKATSLRELASSPEFQKEGRIL